MNIAAIPMQTVGPIKILSEEINGEVFVPLATFETPLWPSVNRGARVSKATAGIRVTIIREGMTRSVVFSAEHAGIVLDCANSLQDRLAEINEVVSNTSRFAKLQELHSQIVGNLLYLRFSFFTGDAAGHNMVTQAADHIMKWISQQYPQLNYVSISANFCTDKKASAVNGILGRGKYAVAEITIPNEVCQRLLKTTPEKIVDLHIKKNLLGTLIAGGIRSANAHFANMLLAFYLATGQDAANIVEGSQGIVHTEVLQGDLYFSVTLPNIIIGSIGNGKELEFVQNNLQLLDCLKDRPVGENARRLAAIAAATVLCGELSLLAAQTNPGELMKSHLILERRRATREKSHDESRN